MQLSVGECLLVRIRQEVYAADDTLPIEVTQSLFFSTECKKHIGNNSPAWGKKKLQTFTCVVMGSKVTAASKERGLGASTSAQSSLVVMLKIIREREQKIPPGYCLNAWCFYILSTVCNSSLSSSKMI